MDAIVAIYIIGIVVAYMQLNSSGHNDPLIGALLWPITLLGAIVAKPGEGSEAARDSRSEPTPIGTTDDYVEVDPDDDLPPPPPKGRGDEPPKPRF